MRVSHSSNQTRVRSDGVSYVKWTSPTMVIRSRALRKPSTCWIAAPALRHRLIFNFHAEAEGVRADQIVEQVVKQVPEETR